MKKVLITGLTGFTGIHLRDELVEYGYSVVGLTLPSQFENLALDSVNITQLEKIRGSLEFHQPDFIIHLAGISFSAHSAPEEYYSVNVLGTENLLKAVRDALPNVEKVILASSGAVYGNIKQEILDETLCPKPVNHYAFSKLSMEHLAATWFDSLPITIVRPFNYVGLGQKENFLVPKIVSHFVERKREIQLGNLNISRDFSDVRDICRYYRQLLAASTHGATLNLCSGTMNSLQNILYTISDITKHNLDVFVNPDFVRENEILRLRGSTDNLYRAIGPQTKKPLRETLAWMLDKPL